MHIILEKIHFIKRYLIKEMILGLKRGRTCGADYVVAEHLRQLVVEDSGDADFAFKCYAGTC